MNHFSPACNRVENKVTFELYQVNKKKEKVVFESGTQIKYIRIRSKLETGIFFNLI